MSRSFKKTPIMGITKRSSRAKNQSEFRSNENKRNRRNNKQILNKFEDQDELLNYKQFGNEWNSPRDGKQYFGGIKDKIKYMRK